MFPQRSFLLGACIALASCSGSGGAAPAAVATPNGTTTNVLTLSAAGTASQTTAVGGGTATVTVGALASPASASLAITTQTYAPVGVPAPASVEFTTPGNGHLVENATPIAYIELTANQNLSFAGIQAVSITLPGLTNAQYYSLDSFDTANPNAGWLASYGPATSGSSTLNFSGSNATVVMTAGQSTVLALFAGAPPS